ncbi:MAG TPA: RNA-binding S4 domain-containing protein [Clostridiaceae bacterium]|nr:RNA-binding S4 domain-containing protein [Clostridiaceae bacterium]
MRLDKFLKVSRIVKRRTVANEMCSAGRVKVNDRIAKPGTTLEPGDIIEIGFGTGNTRVKVKRLANSVKKEEAADLYEIIST